MEIGPEIRCPRCGSSHQEGDPFCVECGEPLPSLVSPGDVCVELGEVPSQKLRADALRALRSWFPTIDPFQADTGLMRGGAVLICGIDEDSATRIARALETMKIQARLKRPDTWLTYLTNGGLAISAAALVLAALVPLGAAIPLVLGAIGAPVVGAILKKNRRSPLTRTPHLDSVSETWVRLAAEYADLIGRLEPDVADTLKSTARSAFDLARRLSRASLASAAAGEAGGDLYSRLQDAVLTALETSRRVVSEPGKKREALKDELDNLADLMRTTGEWFRALEAEELKEVPALADDLKRISASIDDLVAEVRSPDSPVRGEKALL
jgi:hypothetical protein